MFFQRLAFHRHLDSGESLLFVAHRHWIELIPICMQTAVFGFVLPLTMWFFVPAILWGALAWIGIFWIWFLYKVADWYFDAWLSTTASIIDVEWNGFFHQTSTRIPYSEVRDISWQIKGVWSTILGYGDCTISMATGGKVFMKNIESPKKVELQIIEIRDEFLSAQRMNQSSALHELLSGMVSDHIEKSGVTTRYLEDRFL
jgi:hypothetical protein